MEQGELTLGHMCFEMRMVLWKIGNWNIGYNWSDLECSDFNLGREHNFRMQSNEEDDEKKDGLKTGDWSKILCP